jgi:nucleotide-binding universal stress UspA family protein
VAILLAVDGSESALSAARKVVELAACLKAMPRVELITVHLPVPQVGGLSNVVSRETVDRYYREEGEAALAGARKVLESAGIAYSAHVFVGKPAHTIVEQAERLGCEAIFMGSRGLSTVESVLVGSCATKVLHLARIPVVLVH